MENNPLENISLRFDGPAAIWEENFFRLLKIPRPSAFVLPWPFPICTRSACLTWELRSSIIS